MATQSTTFDAPLDLPVTGVHPAIRVQPAAEKEKVLPLAGWLVKVYFIFPVVLYIPDAIFNYYVYSDGWTAPNAPLVAVFKVALVSFLSIGVVGMAYLLSVLAPWHWGQGHHIQAFFCSLGVVIATAITTWNSLAYRSGAFVEFNTDKWAYNFFPALKDNHVSITMILVSIAPPFWGLFWAIVQPTATGRSMRQLEESHQEKLVRLQHEAEVKRLKAETNAKVREAQLRGMASTAAAARQQAQTFLKRDEQRTEKPVEKVTVAPKGVVLTPDDPDDTATRPEFPAVRLAEISSAQHTTGNTGSYGDWSGEMQAVSEQPTGSFLTPLRNPEDSGSRHDRAAKSNGRSPKSARASAAKRAAAWAETNTESPPLDAASQ